MTNEVLQCLETRRSIRSFKSDMVEKEKLEAVIKAGSFAASGRNRQAGIIIAVTDPAVRNKISKMNAEIMGTPDEDPFYGAPVIFIVLANRAVPTYVYDGSLVIGNMMNAAHSIGLGSIWIHRAKQEFESEEGKALLKEWGIEGDYEGIGHLALGYINGDYPNTLPRKDNRIFWV